MQAKFEDHYSSAEKEDILSALIECGLLTRQEVDAQSEHFADLQINFHSINDLLSPFLHKFAWHMQWERKVYPWHEFYTSFAATLIQKSPLLLYKLNCYFDTKADRIVIESGLSIKSISFETYPEYLIKLTSVANELIADCLHGWEFYEIDIVDISTFLLLKKEQYNFLLENRLVRFTQVEYPEETAWRSTLREEDFLF